MYKLFPLSAYSVVGTTDHEFIPSVSSAKSESALVEVICNPEVLESDLIKAVDGLRLLPVRSLASDYAIQFLLLSSTEGVKLAALNALRTMECSMTTLGYVSDILKLEPFYCANLRSAAIGVFDSKLVGESRVFKSSVDGISEDVSSEDVEQWLRSIYQQVSNSTSDFDVNLAAGIGGILLSI